MYITAYYGCKEHFFYKDLSYLLFFIFLREREEAISMIYFYRYIMYSRLSGPGCGINIINMDLKLNLKMIN